MNPPVRIPPAGRVPDDLSPTLQRAGRLLLALACSAILGACASRPGGYYKDDGPGARIPADVAAIPNAVPRVEQHAPANFRPYEVFGVRYQPLAENQPYEQTGTASWYGRKFHGARTANGEIYDMYTMTAAHPTLPLPSYAIVTRPANGRSIIVRINDRGPFHSGRIIDLSWVAAAKLGLIGPGSGTVVVKAITNSDILAGHYPGGSPDTATAIARAPTGFTTPVATASPPVAPGEAADPAATPVDPEGLAHVRHEPAGGGIYLQYGAFSSADNAQALATRVNTRLEGLGIPVSVSRQAALYKVRSGPYPSRDQAAQDAGLLLETLGLQPVIALDQGF
ncbi:septal ring lytic transglycosylase RlpA family protein [Castellaniella sp.]|uniref:septal ring lytic transglycosylase RlpA family protein n=1 Tax=Castellaniella sp. TaxID=1955812 RepID=UPI00355EB47E